MRRTASCDIEDCRHEKNGECTILSMNGQKVGSVKMLCAFYKRDVDYSCDSCLFCESTKRLYCREHNAYIPFAKRPACASYKPIRR